MKSKIYNIIVFGIIWCSQYGLCQSNEFLNNDLHQIAKHEDFKNANLSLSVIELTSGEFAAGFRSQKVLVPASSLKLLFSLSAIDILGKDFQFVTNLSYDGEIEFDGTLKGNIYIEGSGDPSLGAPDEDGILSFEDLLASIVEGIKREGIICIDGDIIADESIINTSPVSPSWQWNDLGNYYASGAWGINVHENLYYIKFGNRALRGRRPIIMSVYPRVDGLKLSNELVVDAPGTGDNAYIFGGPYNFYKRIIGTIPEGSGSFTIKGSIPDPPRFFAYHIQKALERSKIKSGEIRSLFETSPQKLDRISVAKYTSPPLIKLVEKCNVESNNLYSEAISKRIGLEKYGRASGQNGIRAIQNLLDEMGVEYSGINLEDGSGLSARNYISSFTLADFLQKFAQRHGVDNATNLLARPGVDGNMNYLFKNSEARGSVWLKSGSMSRIMSYTGYIKSKSGNWCSFSIIVNGFDIKSSIMRSHLEKIMEAIYLQA